MVSKELAQLHAIQKELVRTQHENWKIVEEQFQVFHSNIHILRDCTQLLYTNQQLNFNFDTVASLLSMIYTNIKSYRAALFSYRLTLVGSIPTLLQRHLPMALVPRASLLLILKSVARLQDSAPDRLSLAIPMTDLSYYDAKLLHDVATVPEGLLLTLSIPLASKQTVFNVYHAQPIPMPKDDQAVQWKIEAPYLAISEDTMETAPLSEIQINECIGSARYKICHEAIATELGHSSCLATLFLGSQSEALTACSLVSVTLPPIEKATNLGFGIWLITAAHDTFTLRESGITNDHAHGQTIPGCRVCIITLTCGRQLISPNIKFRSDLTTCQQLPAKFIDVQLNDPLAHLLSLLPDISELPHFPTATAAGVELLREVQAQLVYNKKTADLETIVEIARPLADTMRQLKPSFTRELATGTTIQMTLVTSITSFVGSMILHVLFVWAYYNCRVVRRSTPETLKLPTTAESQDDVQSEPHIRTKPYNILCLQCVIQISPIYH